MGNLERSYRKSARISGKAQDILTKVAERHATENAALEKIIVDYPILLETVADYQARNQALAMALQDYEQKYNEILKIVLSFKTAFTNLNNLQ